MSSPIELYMFLPELHSYSVHIVLQFKHFVRHFVACKRDKKSIIAVDQRSGNRIKDGIKSEKKLKSAELSGVGL